LFIKPEAIIKIKILTILFLVFWENAAIQAEVFLEYEQLLEQLKNYNTEGFFIINSDNSWQRGSFLKADFDSLKINGMESYTKICLVPFGQGFFQFFDATTGKLIYCRNAILNVNHEGILCNIDDYQLYPIIKINKQWAYKIDYKNGKLTVEYPENDIFEEYAIYLYWPSKIINELLFGVYFYFDDVDILNNGRIATGFIELSSVDFQLTLVKMIKLIVDIKTNYIDSVIFESGNAETTLKLLQSLLIASYIVNFESPLHKADDYQIIPGPSIETERYTLQFPDIYLPVIIPNNDPLRLNIFYNFLKIKLRSGEDE
jgi:hypothetical protein